MKATVFFDGQFPAAEWEDELVRCPGLRKQVHVEHVEKKIDVVLLRTSASRSRQTTITAQRGPDDDSQKNIAATLVHLNQKAFFDPAQLGKVEGIDFYLDLMNVDSTPGVDVHYAIALRQDGVLFQSPPARLTGNKKWKGFISESLSTNDFVRLSKPTAVSPQTRPDFGKRAASMQVMQRTVCDSPSRGTFMRVLVQHRLTFSPLCLPPVWVHRSRCSSGIQSRECDRPR